MQKWIQWTLLAICLVTTGSLIAQKKLYSIRQATDEIAVDGKLSEPIWDEVEWSSAFRQKYPQENGPSAHETHFAAVQRGNDLYFAIRCGDDDMVNHPGWLGKRDSYQGDYIEVQLDVNLDRQTAYSFSLTSAGVKGDEIISGDGRFWDAQWNPIWDGRLQMDSSGWTVEMSIPIAELRGTLFDSPWGLQVTRKSIYAQEKSQWQWISKSRTGYVSQFGTCQGVQPASQRIYLKANPYLAWQSTSGEAAQPKLGMDATIQWKEKSIVDLSIHPDFGQIEADPSNLVLDGYEIFQQERRPFFNADQGERSFALSENDALQDQLYYSRRIGGRSPSQALDDGTYAPAKILWSSRWQRTQEQSELFVLGAGMESQYAQTDRSVRRMVNPQSTAWIAGWQWQNRKKTQQWEWLGTHLGNRLNDESASSFIQGAQSMGIKLSQWIRQRWLIRSAGFVSRLAGSPTAVQSSFQGYTHYLQRPGLPDYLPESKSTASGTGGEISVEWHKPQSGWFAQGGMSYRSPLLHLNTLGFQQRADHIQQFFHVGYTSLRPGSWYRRMSWNLYQWNRWNFRWEHRYLAFQSFWHIELPEGIQLGIGVSHKPIHISDRALFGGPSIPLSRGESLWLSFGTDRRKKISAQIQFTPYQGRSAIRELDRKRQWQASVQYRPKPAVRAVYKIQYGRDQIPWQYHSRISSTEGMQYILAHLDWRTVSHDLRLEWSLNPNLSFQLWTEQYFTQGYYDHYQNGHALDSTGSKIQSSYVYPNYRITDNGILLAADSSEEFTIRDRSFYYFQWTLNAVLRWEYRPGSEFFLVMSNRSGTYLNPYSKFLTIGEFNNVFQPLISGKITYLFNN